jgi:aromatic-L-amino-acid/L-tryptophan decarboxylase
MDPASFRRHGHDLVDWITEYLEDSEKYPVLSRVKPGEIVAALPSRAPEESESFDAIMADFSSEPRFRSATTHSTSARHPR